MQFEWCAPHPLPNHQANAKLEEHVLSKLKSLAEEHKPDHAFLQSFGFDLRENAFRFEFEPKRSDIQFIRDKVFWVLCDELGAPEKVGKDMILAFEEALSNVIRHSYSENEAPWVELLIGKEEQTLRLELCDRGENGRSQELIDLWETITRTGRPPLRKRGGLGLFLIKRIMTDVSYTIGSKNCLKMLRNLEPTS